MTFNVNGADLFFLVISTFFVNRIDINTKSLLKNVNKYCALLNRLIMWNSFYSTCT